MKDWRTIALIAVVLIFAAYLSYQEFIKQSEGHTINPRLLQLQDSLAQSAIEKRQMETAYQDSMANLRQREAQLLADTANHSNITQAYDSIRQKHRSMEMDRAVALLHYRLRVEKQYSARFDYSYLPN